MTAKRITRASAADLRRMRDRTDPKAPAGPSLGAAFWKEARLVLPATRKQQLTLRLDPDLVAFFKRQGRGYQTRINAVLRAFVAAQRHDEA